MIYDYRREVFLPLEDAEKRRAGDRNRKEEQAISRSRVARVGEANGLAAIERKKRKGILSCGF